MEVWDVQVSWPINREYGRRADKITEAQLSVVVTRCMGEKHDGETRQDHDA